MEIKEPKKAESVELPIRPAPQVKFDLGQDPKTVQDIKHTGTTEQHESENDEKDEEGLTAEVDLVLPKKKKKRPKRPKSKRGINKPTGFEEFYVDPPITVEENNEEKAIYDVSRPILHRLEHAILRFQAKRRIESDRRHIFVKYLAYGGVDVGPKMFTGVDQKELAEMDKDQILAARGQASISSDRSKLKIDFDAVVKGYLTSYFPQFFSPDTEDMVKMATVTIKNFLTYLLHHEVCPEYRENIDAARVSCDIVAKELWKNQRLIVEGPGNFNTACSTLFGGSFFDFYVEDSKWTDPDDDSVRMTTDIARKVVKFALAGAGSNEQATRFRDLANENALNAVRIEDIDGFEITAVFPAEDDLREFYHQHAPDLNPVGKLHGKAYRDLARPQPDLTPEERLEWEKGNLPTDEFEFILEENLLNLCYPGMKVITSVWKLNCGIYFFDEVLSAYCSIYTVLPNDLMLGWKKPKSFMDGEEGDDESGAENGNEEADGNKDKKNELQDFL